MNCLSKSAEDWLCWQGQRPKVDEELQINYLNIYFLCYLLFNCHAHFTYYFCTLTVITQGNKGGCCNFKLVALPFHNCSPERLEIMSSLESSQLEKPLHLGHCKLTVNWLATWSD